MSRFVVHKTRGTVKIVTIEAELVEFEPGGTLAFWIKQHLVMAYSPWAWKTVYQEEE